MAKITGLKCRECGRPYPADPLHVCEFCFGPLEVDYDYGILQKLVTRKRIEAGPPTMWRYRDLLPVASEEPVGTHCGMTPLIRAKNLAEALGAKELYIKNDAVCHPSLSFKDRVVAVAVTKAIEFGFPVVACASTGNLANSVAAHAAEARLKSFIFVPADLEQGKIVGTLIYDPVLVAVDGNYDEVNRLCSEVAGKYGWAFVNITIRPYYAEGSKTFGYEIVEQLGWRTPRHIVVPAAGGSLVTKIWKGLKEFHRLGLIPDCNTRMHVAQPAGCAPIVAAVRSRCDTIRPVRPNTICKSLAIGNPADGYYAYKTAEESRGGAADPTDEEIIAGMTLLAATEGIFTETAGGVTVAAAKRLLEAGVIPPDESIVLSITGNGLKTQEVVTSALKPPLSIKPTLKSFDEVIADRPDLGVAVASRGRPAPGK
jgi:threonine synthase